MNTIRKIIGAVAVLAVMSGAVACSTTSADSRSEKDWETLQRNELRDNQEHLNRIKGARKVAQGWAREVGPVDGRQAYEIEESLKELNGLRMTIAMDLDWSNTAVQVLNDEVHGLMVDDLSGLLNYARSENDLRAMKTFVSFASKATDDPKKAFGKDASELRDVTRGIIAGSIAEYRRRDGTLAVAQYARSVNSEWNIPIEDLHLLPKEVRAVETLRLEAEAKEAAEKDKK